MFRKTNIHHQGDLFADSIYFANSRTIDALEGDDKWFNKFYQFITSRIDEDKFKPLFKDGIMGAPNASVRELVALNILKDGLGNSDEQLFESAACDLRIRKALGVASMTEKIPSLQVYYMFRRRLLKYRQETGIDLMRECFKDNVKDILCTLNISGKSIRMDSKLIGSNIAWFSRYELVQKMYVKYVTPLLDSLNPSLRKKAEAIINRDGQKDQYKLTKAEIEVLFTEMGIVLQKILVKIKASDDHILRRLFNEQYSCEEGQAQPKDNRDISADSIQSPYDTDAAYRIKGDQKIKGYSTNITETVPEAGEMSVITDVQLEPATAADNDFLQKAVVNTEDVTGTRVETVYSDGAYQSESNREFAESNNITLYTCGLQGKESRYDYTVNAEGDIIVTDKQTGEIYIARQCKQRKNSTKKSWSFTDSTGKRHYVTEKAIEISELRKQISSTPPELMNKRNNVEAGMFQYSFYTRNGKTRYRTKFKHEIHAYARCIWMNFRRRLSYIKKLQCQGTLEVAMAR